MKQVVIENPILNSPFDETTRHFRFTDEAITDEIVAGRRVSTYFVPIARPKKKGKQKSLYEAEEARDRVEENKLVTDIRRQVALWREGGAPQRHADDRPTARLLDRPRPRQEALLLPDRSARDRHLYRRGRQEGRARLGRKRPPRGQRHVQPRPAARRVQDGYRLRQDRRHGHAHRLAHAQ